MNKNGGFTRKRGRRNDGLDEERFLICGGGRWDMAGFSVERRARPWWQLAVFSFEAYLVLAGMAGLVWAIQGECSGSALGFVFCGCLLSCPVLLITGITLLFRKRPKWGWTAIAFAAYGLVLLLLLPALLKSK
jgi:hypothetical protein